jgi:DNA ligase-associated metallophosphoesterase
MNAHALGQCRIAFRGETLSALASGALHWPGRGILVVSDLHLGKSERNARRGGPMLPPYEGIETLDRLASDIAQTRPQLVLCLGDSFDDLTAASAVDPATEARLGALMAGRRWIWIEGNHDPGPIGIGGAHMSHFADGPLVFRHVATPSATGEVSGHYHPKARLATRRGAVTRRCFLVDRTRIVLPAYGTYTGGLRCDGPELSSLMDGSARAILLGRPPVEVPMPRCRG